MTVHFNPEAVQVQVDHDGLHEKRSEQKEEFKINIDPDFVDVDFGNIGKRNIIEPVYDVPVVGGVVRGTGVGAGEEQRLSRGQRLGRRKGEEEEGGIWRLLMGWIRSFRVCRLLAARIRSCSRETYDDDGDAGQIVIGHRRLSLVAVFL